MADEKLRCRALRVIEHIHGGANFGNFAMVDNGNAVAGTLRHVQRVRDHDHGHAQLAIDVAQQIQNLDGRAAVKGAGSLVAKHDFRLIHQGARNGHALLLATGKFTGIALRFVGNAHAFQQLKRTFLVLLATNLQGEHDVFQHGALLEQAEMLEDHAHAAAELAQRLAGIFGHIFSIDDNIARAGLFQHVDAAHQRGFARAGFTDDAKDVAVLNSEAHVVKRREFAFARAVNLGNVVNFNHVIYQPYSQVKDVGPAPGILDVFATVVVSLPIILACQRKGKREV